MHWILIYSLFASTHLIETKSLPEVYTTHDACLQAKAIKTYDYKHMTPRPHLALPQKYFFSCIESK